MIIKALPFLRKEDAPTFGAKAANLGEAAHWQYFNIPDGYAIRFHGHEELSTSVIRALFGSMGAVAVRSSGIGEDGASASFAGQHDTFLNVDRDYHIAQAIGQCRMSVYSPEALAYRKEHGITESPQIAVIVQKMVDAKCAGVAFTHHPITGEDCVVIEATSGLGDKLVSGEIVPDQYTWRFRNGNTFVDKEVVNDPVLSPKDVLRIVELARGVQFSFGNVPQDIEWALDHDDVLWLLQARPITTLKMAV